MQINDYTSAVKRNSNRIYRIALSFVKTPDDAEDIVQDVFLKLWKQEDFANDEHIDKWLTTVCINKSKDYIKSPFRKRVTSLDNAKESYNFDNNEKLDIYNAVMSLSKKERVVIHLYYYEELTITEIAKLLKVKESAAKVRLHRARNNLKEILGEEWFNE